MQKTGTKAWFHKNYRPKERRIQGCHCTFEERLRHSRRGKTDWKGYQYHTKSKETILLNAVIRFNFKSADSVDSHL
jgi:hypothetical protein